MNSRSLRQVLFALLFPAMAQALDSRTAATLRILCDTLVSAQITDRNSPDFGALVCPSHNPQEHPLHSRAAEAAYPLAVVYRTTHDARYRDAARHLADWLFTKQQPNGAWGEDWPKHDGWNGTTYDQLISLASAYPIFAPELAPAERARWLRAIRSAADFTAANPAIANINYHPTGAVALELAARVVENPPPRWRERAAELIRLTLASINADNLIVGEGQGVDLGYNLAQSIGYLALYGLLTHDEPLRHRAAELLRAHAAFVYPNGSVDNSWGTRSFKWTYESGTKTAPGVYFSFALLADQDERFGSIGDRCFDFLVRENLADGLVTYGPHAARHASTHPPCLYSTFVRAQSLATEIDFAPALPSVEIAAPRLAPPPGRFFPTVNVAVVRTEKMMATVSAYGGIARYGRELVSRGGSLTNLWIDGFGPRGFAQTSSVTRYQRPEPAHMPLEGDLLPLTPRIECTIDGVRYTNLFEANGTMRVDPQPDCTAITVAGQLRDAAGRTSNIGYVLTHRFYRDRVVKQFELTSPRDRVVTLVEPFVNDPGATFTSRSANTFEIHPPGSHVWQLTARGAALRAGEHPERYWCPFPAVECFPIVAEVTLLAGARTIVELALAPR